jgi:hypothetical protein
MVRDLLNHARESPADKISGVTQNWPFLNHAVFQRASCHIASRLTVRVPGDPAIPRRQTKPSKSLLGPWRGPATSLNIRGRLRIQTITVVHKWHNRRTLSKFAQTVAKIARAAHLHPSKVAESGRVQPSKVA